MAAARTAGNCESTAAAVRSLIMASIERTSESGICSMTFAASLADIAAKILASRCSGSVVLMASLRASRKMPATTAVEPVGLIGSDCTIGAASFGLAGAGFGLAGAGFGLAGAGCSAAVASGSPLVAPRNAPRADSSARMLSAGVAGVASTVGAGSCTSGVAWAVESCTTESGVAGGCAFTLSARCVESVT